MARTTYYYNIRPREDKYAQLRKDIIRIFNKNKCRYGYRRVYQQLRAEGKDINHKTLAKLIVEMGLYARKPKLRYRSYKGEIGKIAPNVLQRDFATDAPNRKWTSIEDFKVALKEYIRYYNNERIKLKLKMSPVQYRTHFQNQVK